MSNGVEEQKEVTREAVYGEMYNELRRYRDYEFTSSTWYTAILVAILGFLVATRFENTAEGFSAYFQSSCFLRCAVIFVSAIIAGASTFLVNYSYRRYRELRNYTTNHLEPKWKAEAFKPREYEFVPRHIYYITPWFVFILILLITVIDPPAKKLRQSDKANDSTVRNTSVAP